MVKISILVAVYNTARYIPQCLDSLLGQTLGDFQVICVDDASTDDSWAVLQSYAAKDSRIEILRLSENHGQAFARNQGLRLVKGTYTCFLDSDDWLEKDALEQVVATFERNEEIDSVLFRCLYYYSADRIEEYPMSIEADEISGEQAFEESLTWKIHGVYAVKTSIQLRYPYDDSARSYSDDNTTRLHYLASQKVAFSIGTYYYRQHSASVTHRVSARRFDYLKANANMMETLRKLKISSRLLAIYENERWLNVVDVYLFYWQHAHELSLVDRRAGLALVRKYWKSIDFKMVYPRNKRKLGYLSFRSFVLPEPLAWCLFRWQADFYFFMKKVSGKL